MADAHASWNWRKTTWLSLLLSLCVYSASDANMSVESFQWDKQMMTLHMWHIELHIE